jgi:hypothetical protein
LDGTNAANSSLSQGSHPPEASLFSIQAGYSDIIDQFRQSHDNELEKYIPQLTHLLIDERAVAGMHMLSVEQCHALEKFERFMLERCASNFALGFKMYCAVKVCVCVCVCVRERN